MKKIDMYLKLTTPFVAIFLMAQNVFGAAPKPIDTVRGWGYLNATAKLSPNWSFTAMPGYRYEFTREQDGKELANIENFYNELFVGPAYHASFGKNLKFSLPVWYYYMAFPNYKDASKYEDAHNLTIIPVFAYKLKNFVFVSRTIFHNTLYASVNNDKNEDPAGYGLLLREMILVNYIISKPFLVYAGSEIWVGAIENKDATPHPLGYFPNGLARSRYIAGFKWKATECLTINPEYMYETQYGVYTKLIPTLNKSEPWINSHYLRLTVEYAFKAYSDKKPEAPAEPKAETKPLEGEQTAPAEKPAEN